MILHGGAGFERNRAIAAGGWSARYLAPTASMPVVEPRRLPDPSFFPRFGAAIASIVLRSSTPLPTSLALAFSSIFPHASKSVELILRTV